MDREICFYGKFIKLESQKPKPGNQNLPGYWQNRNNEYGNPKQIRKSRIETCLIAGHTEN
ncbi:MAG: hypothetical protein AMS27_03430 [Bacteroides sp. SM23_62_1]|nr:MAG: hypothetical protein AMS27_03430 [Bacteroides sp. SM23_62_1]